MLPRTKMRALVESLCSDECAGRAPGTPGGALARRLVRDALRDAGLDPSEQLVPACNGGNVLATIPGEIDRWILVAAHHDHLGQAGREVFRGADDNAAAVAILVEVARALAAKRQDGRGVIIASFDAEEPPYFMTKAMGSEHFARNPIVPLDRIDLMVCMDLVGHALGAEGLPNEVRNTVFALGAERSAGTREILDETAESERGVVVRRVDAETVPPLSDYAAFWTRKRPFLLLTNARSRVYHTPDDRPELLAWDKMEATARWLERFVRANAARDEQPFTFQHRRDDISTLDSFLALTAPILDASEQARIGHTIASDLRALCDANGVLPMDHRVRLGMLVAMLESGLA